MSKPSLAIIGTGIAGMGSAYFLQKEYDLTLFEKGSYIGGHTNTVDVDEDGTQIPIDTGFIVFNHVTYPNLLKLFNTIQAPTKKSDMSFSVQHKKTGIEFCGSGLSGLFVQKKTFFNPKYIKMLLAINRFNEEAPKILDNPKYDYYTLGRYITEEKYNMDLLEFYLVPMSSAVWSTPPDMMLEFPAKSLVRFFYNHGFLGLNTQHQWYTVDRGSREYVKIITKGYQDKVHLNTEVQSVESLDSEKKVQVVTEKGEKFKFDKVILASHGDETYQMLKSPTDLQKKNLSKFRYQKNIATLHTDESLMPKSKPAWSSWNYCLDEGKKGEVLPHTIYWMNRLQKVSEKKNYFVSINDPGRIHPSKVLRTIEYQHPLFSLEAVEAQKSFESLNREGNIHFCGSYFRYGFHEDAFWSSVELSKILLGKDPW